MSRRGLLAFIASVVALAAVAGPRLAAQGGALKTPRIYIFENGHIRGLDTKLFGLAREEVKGSTEFVNVSYLIAHPKGTLQFDAGGIPDTEFKGPGPVAEGVMTADKPLAPQIATTGYKIPDITYFAMSHYHSDHTGNANLFAGSTWIVQKAERDYMFQEKPAGIVQAASYAKLREARTRILDNEDLDVFGDGTVRLISTPGHTPGHQVLFVRLANFGPVVLVGDLYHFPEEATLDRVPGFDFNADQTRASRANVQALLKATGAKMWIEHDLATHAPLPKAPKWVD